VQTQNVPAPTIATVTLATPPVASSEMPVAQVAASVQTPPRGLSASSALEVPPEDEGRGSDLASTVMLILGSAFAVVGFGGALLYDRWKRR
ncbi:MAG TPA: hypothetical protein VG845_10500, partial [Dehalococcoidia bacterium]|nr:hypothetical protein [Dehalococcoidia bacterium]